MTNLVILYTGNVGSTPLVQVAGRHPKICVPVHEDFDRHKFAEFQVDKPRLQALAQTIDQTFQRQVTPYLETDAVRQHRDTDTLPTPSDVPHMVFKWRVSSYPKSEVGSQAVAKMFRRHNAKPALLARRSVVEQAIKVHMTESHYGGRHPQFEAGEMSDADYAARQSAQDAVSIRIDQEGLAACRKLAQSFAFRTKRTFQEARYHFGARPQLIIAEQYLWPEIDYGAASDILSALLGERITLEPDMAPKVRRAGLTLENCANLDELAADPILRKAEQRYQTLLAKMSRAVGPSPDIPFFQRVRARLSPPPLALGAAFHD